MHSKHFPQHEFEMGLNKHLRYKGETAIAELIHISPSMVSQYLNPNDERESPLYKAAAILAAWIEDDETGGTNALTLFNTFVHRALPGDATLSVNERRRIACKEHADFMIAEAEGKPLDVRIEEKEESIAADNRLLDALRAEAKREICKDAFRAVEVNGNGRR